MRCVAQGNPDFFQVTALQIHGVSDYAPALYTLTLARVMNKEGWQYVLRGPGKETESGIRIPSFVHQAKRDRILRGLGK